MSDREAAYLERLQAIFNVEAQEHLEAMTAGLLALEAAPTPGEQAPLLETVYREAHSLKGAARAVNMGEVEHACQKLETIFAALKRAEQPITPDLLDTLHRSVTEIGTLLHAPALSAPGRENGHRQGSAGVALSPAAGNRAASPPVPVPERESALPILPPVEAPPAPAAPLAHPPRPAPSAPPAPVAATGVAPGAEAPRPPVAESKSGAETIRVSTAKLDTLLLQAEELVAAKLTAGHRAAELRTLTGTADGWSRRWAKVRADVRALQQTTERAGQPSTPLAGPPAALRNVLEFLEWNHHFMQDLDGQLAALSKAADQDQRTLAGMTDGLLTDMKKVLMLPFATLLEIFPKMVRDIARDCGKEVALATQGREIEIDRRILEVLKDPLIHLVRNAIDHGLETPTERQAAGKAARGTLTIAVNQPDANKVEIRLTDDGAGIHVDQVRARALQAGLLAAPDAEALDDAAALALIFHSGFSTSPLITELSGRGLGLAIVREKVEKLGGVVTVESAVGSGTIFCLTVPLTLATCRGILVRAAGRLFMVPTTHVERVVSVHLPDIKTVGNRETLLLDGQVLSLVRLAAVLGLPAETGSAAGDLVPAVVLCAGTRRIAFLVAAVLGEEEVLVKDLGPQLVRVRNITGATILGSGQVVPILNVIDLLKAAVQASTGPAVPIGPTPVAPPKAILIAEDSITSRTLLKNILESAGYAVRTAVDGADAFTHLCSADYDLLVSDVEMPHLNGFDLTARVRAHPHLRELPVVLVTSLESREDRARGAEVGANAYLVKRSFEQSNLLDVIHRLI